MISVSSYLVHKLLRSAMVEVFGADEGDVELFPALAARARGRVCTKIGVCVKSLTRDQWRGGEQGTTVVEIWLRPPIATVGATGMIHI